MPSFSLLALLVFLAASSSALPSKQGVTSERSQSSAKESHQDDPVIQDSIAQQSSLSEVELTPGDSEDYDAADEEESIQDTKGDSQHFFPSFAPLFSNSPLGHSRPTIFDDHPRGFSENYRSSSLYGSDEGVLGSGNFGVLRGGTYYPSSGNEEFNGHGGVRGYGRGSNPSPPYRHGGDFFAGFRDFADITTPPKSAYSHYVVVYANPRKEGSQGSVANNILEQLALLDRRTPPKKASKAKQKLALFKKNAAAIEAQKKSKSPKEITEPLIALS